MISNECEKWNNVLNKVIETRSDVGETALSKLQMLFSSYGGQIEYEKLTDGTLGIKMHGSIADELYIPDIVGSIKLDTACMIKKISGGKNLKYLSCIDLSRVHELDIKSDKALNIGISNDVVLRLKKTRIECSGINFLWAVVPIGGNREDFSIHINRNGKTYRCLDRYHEIRYEEGMFADKSSGIYEQVYTVIRMIAEADDGDKIETIIGARYARESYDDELMESYNSKVCNWVGKAELALKRFNVEEAEECLSTAKNILKDIVKYSDKYEYTINTF